MNEAAAGSTYVEYDFGGLLTAVKDIAAMGAPIALVIHVHPDGDAVGSAFAMRALLDALGCPSYVVCADKLPSRLRFIAGDVQEDITGDSAPEQFRSCRAIALDVAAPSQLGELRDAYRYILVIDHHACSTGVGDRFLDPTAAATGEIIWRLAKALLADGTLSAIPRALAAAAYAALSSDTGCFKYSSVTPATHLCAAEMIEMLTDHAEIDRLLFDTKTPERLAAERTALEVLRLYHDGRISVCPMSYEEIARRGLDSEDLDALIDVARSVAFVEVAFSVRGEGNGRYRVSARSNGRFDVSTVCCAYGGGGHSKASGCTVEADSLDAAIDAVVNAVISSPSFRR